MRSGEDPAEEGGEGACMRRRTRCPAGDLGEESEGGGGGGERGGVQVWTNSHVNAKWNPN